LFRPQRYLDKGGLANGMEGKLGGMEAWELEEGEKLICELRSIGKNQNPFLLFKRSFNLLVDNFTFKHYG
jgi:hypothetical protein